MFFNSNDFWERGGSPISRKVLKKQKYLTYRQYTVATTLKRKCGNCISMISIFSISYIALCNALLHSLTHYNCFVQKIEEGDTFLKLHHLEIYALRWWLLL